MFMFACLYSRLGTQMITVFYQTVDEEELQDVQQHSPQRDLQRPQVRVGSEERDEAQGTENVGYGKHCLSH